MQVPLNWRLRAQRYRLAGSTCPICGRPVFPPRPVCPDCTAQPVPIVGYDLAVIPLPDRIKDAVSVEEMRG